MDPGRRAARLAVAVLAFVATSCGGGDDDAAPTTLPPTTQAPTPIEPTGLVDTVRRWVSFLDGGRTEDALALLTPGAAATIGGSDDLVRAWGPWAKTSAAVFDGLPVSAGVAVVVVHARDTEGRVRADAVPARSIGSRWLVSPLEDTGPFRANPAPGSTIGARPSLAVDVAGGVGVTAFVDQQPAAVDPGVPNDAGGLRTAYHPPYGLRPGPHVVTLVFRRGSAVTARAVVYEVTEPD